MMQQTLWAEQMVANRKTETTMTNDYILVHVIPLGNWILLNRDHSKADGQKGMEETLRSCLFDLNKYRITAPDKLLEPIDKKNYRELLDYLNERYRAPLA
ncbi:MAG: hypothetical protein LBL27_00615 [Coriobacteriales bacterium]|nr:hypothetical protein [Coriobacteriales bacterium]